MKSNAFRLAFVTLCFLTCLPCVRSEEPFKEPDLTASKDFGISRGMVTKLPDEALLKNLREDDYAKMTLDDPLLHAAYVEVFWKVRNVLSGEGLRPELMAALNDMKRRGNDVTPVLLKLMSENPYSPFEFAGLKAAYIEVIDPGPYLDYAREALKTRWETLQASDVGLIAHFLLNKGVSSDVELLHEAALKRPYLINQVESEITLVRPQKVSNKESTNSSDVLSKLTQANQPKSAPDIRDGENKSWLVWMLVFVAAAIGAAWLLLCKSKP